MASASAAELIWTLQGALACTPALARAGSLLIGVIGSVPGLAQAFVGCSLQAASEVSWEVPEKCKEEEEHFPPTPFFWGGRGRAMNPDYITHLPEVETLDTGLWVTFSSSGIND